MASFVEEKTGLWSHNDLVKAEKFSNPPHRQNVVSIRAAPWLLLTHQSFWQAYLSFPLCIARGHSSCFGLVSSLAVFSVIIFLGSKKPGVRDLGIQLTVSGSLGSNFSPCKLNKPFARINKPTQVCTQVPTHVYLWLLTLLTSLTV